MAAFHRDFFGDGKVVGGRILPVDEVDGDRLFAEAGPDPGSVAKETVDIAVGVVEGSAPAESGGLVEPVERFGDDDWVVTRALEEFR